MTRGIGEAKAYLINSDFQNELNGLDFIVSYECGLKGFFTKASIEEETKGSKQAAYEPAGDVTDKDDKASKVAQELWLNDLAS